MPRYPFLLTSRILQYSGLAAIGVLVVGSVLTLIFPTGEITQCHSLIEWWRGLWHLVPLCWFRLGIDWLLATPVLALLSIIGIAIKEKDFHLVLIAIVLGGCLFVAFIP